MRVLFCVRHNFHSSPGGAQVQILKTVNHLTKLGVECVITTHKTNIDYLGFDIVHLTDLTWVYDLRLFMRDLSALPNRPRVVLSTIYWPFDDYAKNGAPFIQKLAYKLIGINGFEFCKAIGKLLMRRNLIYLQGLSRPYITSQVEISNFVDHFLPNAFGEMCALNKRLGLSKLNFSIVNNAIDVDFYDEILKEYSHSKDENLIVFAARIDPRKNQLTFLRALLNTSYKIVFVGNPGPNSRSYYSKLKKLAERRGNVEFVSHCSQADVFKLMLRSKVSALTSWVETPGLVSIEALYARCNIVVADKGTVREYFGDSAFYCEPNSEESILHAVNAAMQAKFDEHVLDRVRENYSWANAAQQTLGAYKGLLNEKS